MVMVTLMSDDMITARLPLVKLIFWQLRLFLEKLNLKKMTFNVGDVLGTDPIHALTCVEIPTVVNGERVSRTFMLDPTFRQFCIAEENRFERYNEEERWGVRMATPHPGYFFNLTDEGSDFSFKIPPCCVCRDFFVFKIKI